MMLRKLILFGLFLVTLDVCRADSRQELESDAIAEFARRCGVEATTADSSFRLIRRDTEWREVGPLAPSQFDASVRVLHRQNWLIEWSIYHPSAQQNERVFLCFASAGRLISRHEVPVRGQFIRIPMYRHLKELPFAGLLRGYVRKR